MFNIFEHWEYWLAYFCIGWGFLTLSKGNKYIVWGVVILILGNMCTRQLIDKHKDYLNARHTEDMELYQTQITEHYTARCLSANVLVYLNGDLVWLDNKVKFIFSGNNAMLEDYENE
jgi:hypothetical protein